MLHIKIQNQGKKKVNKNNDLPQNQRDEAEDKGPQKTTYTNKTRCPFCRAKKDLVARLMRK